MSLKLFRSTTALLLLLLFTVHAQQLFKCPPPDDNCGPFGKCVNAEGTTKCPPLPPGSEPQAFGPYPHQVICGKHCQCDAGYWGADCSLTIQHCPTVAHTNSSHVCLNGGSCYETQEVQIKNNESQLVQVYRCDCRRATGEAAAYAGHKCEFGLETSCQENGRPSNYAFCVNGGTCSHYVVGHDHEEFKGCNCAGTGFEGRHCQYRLGSAPALELVYVASGGIMMPAAAASSTKNNDSQPKKKKRTLLWFGLGIVIVGLAVVGAWNRRRGGRRRRVQAPPNPSEIQLPSSHSVVVAVEEFQGLNDDDETTQQRQVI